MIYFSTFNAIVTTVSFILSTCIFSIVLDKAIWYMPNDSRNLGLLKLYDN